MVRWVAAWYVIAALASLGIGLVQLQGPHDDWVFPTACLVAAFALGTGIGLIVGWGPARILGIMLSVAGVVAGIGVIFAVAPILDVVSGGWLAMGPVIAWTLIFVISFAVLVRSLPRGGGSVPGGEADQAEP